MVKKPPAKQETQLQPLGQEDPLQKEMTTHPSIPAWEIPRAEAPGGLQYKGLQRVKHHVTAKESTRSPNHSICFSFSTAFQNISEV